MSFRPPYEMRYINKLDLIFVRSLFCQWTTKVANWSFLLTSKQCHFKPATVLSEMIRMTAKSRDTAVEGQLKGINTST